MYSVAVLSLVVLGNLLVVESARETLCRCEAAFESLYDRRHRHLLQGFERGLKLSQQDGFPYDYGTAYTIDGGYFVIDGVIVLPDSSEICQDLEEDSHQQYSRALRGKLQIAQLGKRRGLKGVMSGAVGNDQRDSSQGYYSYGEGKADGKGVGMRKAMAQVIDILTPSTQTWSVSH
jgi:hypothetical protein